MKISTGISQHIIKKSFLLVCALSILILFAALPGQASASTFYVDGADQVPLAVEIVGPKNSPEILFIHGIGQGRESFYLQTTSDLSEQFRMVSFDLRGHAMSGKPWQAKSYTDSRVWAEDVQRVIEATKLRRPVIVAWSYGTFVAADYIRMHGVERISALMMIGGLGNFVDANINIDDIPAKFARAVKLRTSLELADQKEAAAITAGALVASPVPSIWVDAAKIFGMLVPPHIQAHLRTPRGSNADLIPQLTIPVWVVFGSEDFGKQKQANALKEAMPKSKIIRYEKVGHSPFAEVPDSFNQDLARIVRQTWDANQ